MIHKDVNGKTSSKRLSGMIGMVAFLVMAVLSGLEFYTIDTSLILGGMGICAGLLTSTIFEKK